MALLLLQTKKAYVHQSVLLLPLTSAYITVNQISDRYQDEPILLCTHILYTMTFSKAQLINNSINVL